MNLQTAYRRVRGDLDKLKELIDAGKVDTLVTRIPTSLYVRGEEGVLLYIYAHNESKAFVEALLYCNTLPFSKLVNFYSWLSLQEFLFPILVDRVLYEPRLLLKVRDKQLQSKLLFRAGSRATGLGYERNQEELTELQDGIMPPLIDHDIVDFIEDEDFLIWYLDWVDYMAPGDIKYLKAIHDEFFMFSDHEQRTLQILSKYYTPEEIMRVFLPRAYSSKIEAVVAVVFDQLSMQEFFEILGEIDDTETRVPYEEIENAYIKYREYSDV